MGTDDISVGRASTGEADSRLAPDGVEPVAAPSAAQEVLASVEAGRRLSAAQLEILRDRAQWSEFTALIAASADPVATAQEVATSLRRAGESDALTGFLPLAFALERRFSADPSLAESVPLAAARNAPSPGPQLGPPSAPVRTPNDAKAATQSLAARALDRGIGSFAGALLAMRDAQALLRVDPGIGLGVTTPRPSQAFLSPHARLRAERRESAVGALVMQEQSRLRGDHLARARYTGRLAAPGASPNELDVVVAILSFGDRSRALSLAGVDERAIDAFVDDWPSQEQARQWIADALQLDGPTRNVTLARLNQALVAGILEPEAMSSLLGEAAASGDEDNSEHAEVSTALAEGDYAGASMRLLLETALSDEAEAEQARDALLRVAAAGGRSAVQAAALRHAPSPLDAFHAQLFADLLAPVAPADRQENDLEALATLRDEAAASPHNRAARSALLSLAEHWERSDIDAFMGNASFEESAAASTRVGEMSAVARQHLFERARALAGARDRRGAVLLAAFAERVSEEDLRALAGVDGAALRDTVERIAPTAAPELRRSGAEEILRLHRGDAAALVAALAPVVSALTEEEFRSVVDEARRAGVDASALALPLLSNPPSPATFQFARTVAESALSARFGRSDVRAILDYASGESVTFQGSAEARDWLYQTRVPPPLAELAAASGVVGDDAWVSSFVQDATEHYDEQFVRQILGQALLLNSLPGPRREELTGSSDRVNVPRLLGTMANGAFPSAAEAAETPLHRALFADLRDQLREEERLARSALRDANELTSAALESRDALLETARAHASEGPDFFSRAWAHGAWLVGAYEGTREAEFRAEQAEIVAAFEAADAQRRLAQWQLAEARIFDNALAAARQQHTWYQHRVAGEAAWADAFALGRLGASAAALAANAPAMARDLGLDGGPAPALERLAAHGDGALTSLPSFDSREDVYAFLKSPAGSDEALAQFAVQALESDDGLAAVQGSLLAFAPDLEVIQRLALAPDGLMFDAYVESVKTRGRDLRRIITPDSRERPNPLHQSAKALSGELTDVLGRLPDAHPARARLEESLASVEGYLALVEGREGAATRELLDFVTSDDYDETEFRNWLRRDGPIVAGAVVTAVAASVGAIWTGGGTLYAYLLMAPAAGAVGAYAGQEVTQAALHELREATRREDGSSAIALGAGDSILRTWLTGEEVLNEDGELVTLTGGEVAEDAAERIAYGFAISAASIGVGRYVAPELMAAVGRVVARNPALLSRFQARIDRLSRYGTVEQQEAFARSFRQQFLRETGQEMQQEMVTEQVVAEALEAIDPRLGALSPLLIASASGFSLDTISAHAMGNLAARVYAPSDPSRLGPLLEFWRQNGFQEQHTPDGLIEIRDPATGDVVHVLAPDNAPSSLYPDPRAVLDGQLALAPELQQRFPWLERPELAPVLPQVVAADPRLARHQSANLGRDRYEHLSLDQAIERFAGADPKIEVTASGLIRFSGNRERAGVVFNPGERTFEVVERAPVTPYVNAEESGAVDPLLLREMTRNGFPPVDFAQRPELRPVLDHTAELLQSLTRGEDAESGKEIRVILADTSEVNAFFYKNRQGDPYVVVSLGLLQLMQSDDEAAFILGHELEHGQSLLDPRLDRSDAMRNLVRFAQRTRVTENEVDLRSVVRRVAQAGYNPHGGVSAVTRLHDLFGFGAGATHTAAPMRIDTLNAGLLAWSRVAGGNRRFRLDTESRSHDAMGPIHEIINSSDFQARQRELFDARIDALTADFETRLRERFATVERVDSFDNTYKQWTGRLYREIDRSFPEPRSDAFNAQLHREVTVRLGLAVERVLQSEDFAASLERPAQLRLLTTLSAGAPHDGTDNVDSRIIRLFESERKRKGEIADFEERIAALPEDAAEERAALTRAIANRERSIAELTAQRGRLAELYFEGDGNLEALRGRTSYYGGRMPGDFERETGFRYRDWHEVGTRINQRISEIRALRANVTASEEPTLEMLMQTRFASGAYPNAESARSQVESFERLLGEAAAEGNTALVFRAFDTFISRGMLTVLPYQAGMSPEEEALFMQRLYHTVASSARTPQQLARAHELIVGDAESYRHGLILDRRRSVLGAANPTSVPVDAAPILQARVRPVLDEFLATEQSFFNLVDGLKKLESRIAGVSFRDSSLEGVLEQSSARMRATLQRNSQARVTDEQALTLAAVFMPSLVPPGDRAAVASVVERTLPSLVHREIIRRPLNVYIDGDKVEPATRHAQTRHFISSGSLARLAGFDGVSVDTAAEVHTNRLPSPALASQETAAEQEEARRRLLGLMLAADTLLQAHYNWKDDPVWDSLTQGDPTWLNAMLATIERESPDSFAPLSSIPVARGAAGAEVREALSAFARARYDERRQTLSIHDAYVEQYHELDGFSSPDRSLYSATREHLFARETASATPAEVLVEMDRAERTRRPDGDRTFFVPAEEVHAVLDDPSSWAQMSGETATAFLGTAVRAIRHSPKTAAFFEHLWQRRDEAVVREFLQQPETVRLAFHNHQKERLARWQLEETFQIAERAATARAHPDTLRGGERPVVPALREFVTRQFPTYSTTRSNVAGWLQEELLTNRRESAALGSLALRPENLKHSQEVILADTPYILAQGLNDNQERMELIEYWQGLRATPPNIDFDSTKWDRGILIELFGNAEPQRSDIDQLLEQSREAYQVAEPVGRAAYMQPVIGINQLLADDVAVAQLRERILGPNASNPVIGELYDAYLEALPAGERKAIIAYLLAQAEPGTGAGSLKRVLEAMGTLGIKAGQFLRTSAILPPEQRAELDDFFDQALRPDRGEVFTMLERAFGKRLKNVELVGPLVGSGSINYVVRAWLTNPTTGESEEVVVRMRRGTAAGTVENEYAVLRRVADRLASSDNPEIRRVARVADDALTYAYATIRNHELNQEQERWLHGLAARSYEASHRDRRTGLRTTVVAPRPELQALVAPHMQDAVSVFEAVPSTSLDALPTDQRRAVASQIVEAELRALFQNRVFDPDGHPGNWLIDEAGGRLVRIDYAQLSRISRAELNALKDSIIALARPNPDAAMQRALQRNFQTLFAESEPHPDLSGALERVLSDPDFPGQDQFYDRLLFIQDRLAVEAQRAGATDYVIRIRGREDGSSIQSALASLARTQKYLEDLGADASAVDGAAAQQLGAQRYRRIFIDSMSRWLGLLDRARSAVAE